MLPASMIYTDNYKGYLKLGKYGFTHRRINHSAKIYVEGDVHNAWRYNRRNSRQSMLHALLTQAVQS